MSLCDWSSDVCSSDLLSSQAHHEFGLGELGKKGANGEWGFGLAHEDAGGNVKGFRAAGTHHASHDPSRCPRSEERRVGKEGRAGWPMDAWRKRREPMA